MKKTLNVITMIVVLVSANYFQLCAQVVDAAKDPCLFLKVTREQQKWDEPADPAKIVGPIYSVGTMDLAVYLIKSIDGLVLINTGMPGSGPLIEAAIRKLGFDAKNIKLLLIGHAHCDHAGDVAYIKKISGARIAVIKEEKELLESGGKLDFMYGQYKDYYFEPVKADKVFQDGDTLRVGDIVIKAFLTNGHTKGSTTFVTDVVDAGKKYHVVFPDGLNINAGYRVAKNPSYPGIADNYRRSISILGKLKPDIWLTAHNSIDGYREKLARSAKEGAKAWVDPAGYDQFLAHEKKYLENQIKNEMGIVNKPGN